VKQGTTMSKEIASLLVERAGYVQRGLKDRVKQVDDALASLDHRVAVKESATIEPEAERAVTPRVTKRKG